MGRKGGNVLFLLLMGCAAQATGTLAVDLEYSWGSSQRVPDYYADLIPVWAEGVEVGRVGEEIMLPVTGAQEAFDIELGYRQEFSDDGRPLYTIFGRNNEWWTSPPTQVQITKNGLTEIVLPAHRHPQGSWSCRRYAESEEVVTGDVLVDDVNILALPGIEMLELDGDVVFGTFDEYELWGYFPEPDIAIIRKYVGTYADHADCWNTALGTEPDWSMFPREDAAAYE